MYIPDPNRLIGMIRSGILITAAAMMAADPAWAQIKVGADAACDYNNLQAAVDSIPNGGSDTIHLANNMVAEPVQVVGRSVSIYGGYTSCSDRTSDANDRSIIRGFGGVLPVVFASGFANAQPASLNLTSLIVEQGSSEFGAGVRVGARYAARLSNVLVRDNVSQDSGGGIYLEGSNGASLVLEHGTTVEDNQAGRYGGGVYCKNGLVDFRDGSVSSNEAGAHGGGFFLDNCELTGTFRGERHISHNLVDFLNSGLTDDDLVEEASAAGGGIFAMSGSKVTLGSSNSVTLIEHNDTIRGFYDGGGFANYTIYGRGGGIMGLNSSTVIKLINTHVGHNRAIRGGGAMMDHSAVLIAERSPDGCESVTGYPGCASFFNNTAEGYATGFTACVATGNVFSGQGGGIYLDLNGEAHINGVTIQDNDVIMKEECVFNDHAYDPEGAAVYVDSFAHLQLVNSLVHRNVGSGEDDAFDVIHLGGNQPSAAIAHSTIVGNDSDVKGVVRTTGTSPRLTILSSIVINAGGDGFAASGATDVEVTADCVYANDASDFGNQPGIATRLASGTNPGFVDGSSGNFKLGAGAEAIDFCDASKISAAGLSSEIVNDMDAEDRPVLVVQPGTAYDLGAWEYQTGIAAKVADLGVTIDDGGLNYSPNSTMGYTLTLNNNGPDTVTNPTFFVSLTSAADPYSVIPFSTDWNCNENGQQLTCTYARTLSAGQAAPAVAVQFAAPGIPSQIQSTIEVLASPTVVDPVDGNNRDTATTSIAQDADLFVTNDHMLNRVTPGTRPVYGYHLENIGPNVASQPQITFTFPGVAIDPRIEEVSNSYTCGDVVELPNDTQTLTCERSSLSLTGNDLSVSARIPADYTGDTWTVSARAVSGSDDPDPTNNQFDSVSTVEFMAADLALAGTAPEGLTANQSSVWELTLENQGPGLAQAPVLTGSFIGGAADPMIVSGPDLICVPVGNAPYTGFECLANSDLPAFEPVSVQVLMQPVNAGNEMRLAASVVSATDDPDIGTGSNNEVFLSAPVTETQAGEDALFSDSFE